LGISREVTVSEFLGLVAWLLEDVIPVADILTL